MKTILSSLLCLFAVVGAAVLMPPVTPAMADWNPSDPAKWVQQPDLSPNGMDVNVTSPKILADDWMCTDPRPVTDIHLWGSWLNDLPGDDANLIVQIWSDEPATEQTPSHPKEFLWQPDPDTYVERETEYYRSTEGEWWYDPNTGQAIPGGDHVVWQVNLDVSEDPFPQVPGTIYWLVVQVQVPPTGGQQVGWKTTTLTEGRLDDAVWAHGDLSQSGSTFAWNELLYPTVHPYGEQSINLAFAITVPEPGTLSLLLAGVGLLMGVVLRRSFQFVPSRQ